MFATVIGFAHHFDVLGSVVLLVAVQMVCHLTRLQSPAKFFFCDEVVLISIPVSLSQMMVFGNLHGNIAMTRDHTTVFPARMLGTASMLAVSTSTVHRETPEFVDPMGTVAAVCASGRPRSFASGKTPR